MTKRVYTGAAVGHVRKIVAPLSRKTVKQDEKDWIVVEGAHEGLVSVKDFELAQAMIRKTKTEKRNLRLYPLRSLVRCGNCGRAMMRTKNGNFHCAYGKTNEDSGCSSSARYSEKELEHIVFHAIQMFLKAALENQAEKKAGAAGCSRIRKKMTALAGIQKESEKLKKQKMALYERYSGGEISRTFYLEQKAVFDQRLADIEKELEQLEQVVAEGDPALIQAAEAEFEQEAEACLKESALTWEMAHAFIQAIYLYPDGRREIQWKFKDIAG